MCSWAILRGVGGTEICGSGVMFWAGCVTGGEVGSGEKEGALPMRFAGWLKGQKGPLWQWILMEEYGNITSIFSHIDLTEAQGICYHVICDMLFVYHFFFY